MTTQSNLELSQHEIKSSDGPAAVNFLFKDENYERASLHDFAEKLTDTYGDVLPERAYISLQVEIGKSHDPEQPWLGSEPTTYDELAFSRVPGTKTIIWEILHNGSTLTTLVMQGAKIVTAYSDSGRSQDGTYGRRTFMQPDSLELQQVKRRIKSLANHPTELIRATEHRQSILDDIKRAKETAVGRVAADLVAREEMIKNGALKSRRPQWIANNN